MSVQEDEPLLVTKDEAARLLSVSVDTIGRLLSQASLESVRVGRRRLIPMSEVERVAREGAVLNDR